MTARAETAINAGTGILGQTGFQSGLRALAGCRARRNVRDSGSAGSSSNVGGRVSDIGGGLLETQA
jgi:hypothetical protein